MDEIEDSYENYEPAIKKANNALSYINDCYNTKGINNIKSYAGSAESEASSAKRYAGYAEDEANDAEGNAHDFCGRIKRYHFCNEQPRSKLPRYRIQNATNTQIQTATPQQAARNSFD